MSNACPRGRRFAVAIPARDEEQHLPDCLAALDQAAAGFAGQVLVVVFANGCHDGTVGLLRRSDMRHAQLLWSAASLLPGARHAGWARRLAFEAAADLLRAPYDVLACTDADTCVAPDWITRTVAGGSLRTPQ